MKTETKDNTLPVIGFEIHVELATDTKMFCRCANRFGDPPNTHTCPVCIGMPGALPVMNRQAVDYSMIVGLALNCRLPEFTKWDRKSYYYPDLPKNYQISQYDLPLAIDGHLDIPLPDGQTRRIGVTRAHLEEDAGKNVHDFPAHTGVDLNRAGVPLLEIVTEPDIRSVEEVMSFARAMQRLVRWLGVSEANMEMGQMRFEPNISLWVGDTEKVFDDACGYFTPIFEVKNLNSFRSLERTCRWVIDYHQAQIAEKGRGWSLADVGKQNWGFRDDLNACEFQRGKEEAHDYRYFPDPDLAPVAVDNAWRQKIAARIGELPITRKARYISQYQLTEKQADALTLDAPTGDLLDAAVAAGADAKQCVNLLLGRGAAIANERGCAIAEIGITPEQLAELAKMLAGGEINATAADKIFTRMVETDAAPSVIAESEALLVVSDAGKIGEWVNQAIAKNPQAVEDVRAGGKKQKKAFGFLTGQVMQLSGGAAAPAEVQKLLHEKLGG
ncbi:MAG: Asp-tRNA(Asn)/Glu-tRNA(Gln) amidotransferase subunit GatB [Planctomycetota bacterium]|nr:Asp-tRNA(Asn)/Glu-tRNA(Gln) amidotransferase subunit GatB [Planctomycetota bacterium]